MNKIFLVTEGSYSSYRVIAVFSTRYRAAKFIKKWQEINRDNPFGEQPQIETYALDNPPEEWVITYVRMNKEGQMLETWQDISEHYGSNDWGFDVKGNLYYPVHTEDIQRAIKVTNERRTQLIALNQWKGK